MVLKGAPIKIDRLSRVNDSGMDTATMDQGRALHRQWKSHSNQLRKGNAMDFPVGIRPHGNGLQIRITHKGIEYAHTYETQNPHSKRAITAAVRERADLKNRLKLGLSLRVDENGANALLGDLTQDYLDTLDVERSTAVSYLRLLNQHWLPNFGHWLITDIRPSHIKKYLNNYENTKTGKSISQKTKVCAMVPLRNVFNHAIADGLIEVNPCSAIKFTKGQKPPIERFSLKEKAGILKQLSGQGLVYFTLLFETGMRPSEILALTWDDYDGESLHVNKAIVWRKLKASTKNHEVREVFVSDPLRKALSDHPTRFQKSYIFLNTKGTPHLDTDVFNGHWKAALTKARVRYRIPYTCRHTRAAEMLTGGIEPAFAAAQLGHTIEMFFRTYTKWVNELRDNEQKDKLKNLAQNWTGKTGDIVND